MKVLWWLYYPITSQLPVCVFTEIPPNSRIHWNTFIKLEHGIDHISGCYWFSWISQQSTPSLLVRLKTRRGLSVCRSRITRFTECNCIMRLMRCRKWHLCIWCDRMRWENVMSEKQQRYGNEWRVFKLLRARQFLFDKNYSSYVGTESSLFFFYLFFVMEIIMRRKKIVNLLYQVKLSANAISIFALYTNIYYWS